MKSCNRSPCSFTACAMVSCTWILSDAKHHPVIGITPRQGMDHKWNEQGSTLAMFGSEAVPLLTAASWQFNPTQGGLLKDQSCSIWCNVASTRGSTWDYKVKTNYLPGNQEKEFFLIHPSCMKAGGRRMASFHIKIIPHGRCVFAWAFLWVAVHFKTISYLKAFKNRERTVFDLLGTISHLYFFFIEH